jgi:DNA repair exonuclease SbcCD nuclease subunit
VRIAITADVHLTTRANNPERFEALSNIFKQCAEQQIQLLIIAGDLFDSKMANYAEFEDLYKNDRPPDLTTVILPGNHDSNLEEGAILGDGLLIYSQPTLQPLNDSRMVLFIPYNGNQTMGEVLASYKNELSPNRWILVGHGDWIPGRIPENPYEKGLYMPLTRSDLRAYQPEMTFLGHIHLPQQEENVYSPGSPCPVDRSEIGLRHFIILDTETGEINYQPVESHVIYFNEKFVLIPLDNGLGLLQKEIQERIKGWKLPPGWEQYADISVSITGSTFENRKQIVDLVNQEFKKFSFSEKGGPDLTGLIHTQDPDQAEIASQFKTWLDDLEWPPTANQPGKDQILEEALKIIYWGSK